MWGPLRFLGGIPRQPGMPGMMGGGLAPLLVGGLLGHYLTNKFNKPKEPLEEKKPQALPPLRKPPGELPDVPPLPEPPVMEPYKPPMSSLGNMASPQMQPGMQGNPGLSATPPWLRGIDELGKLKFGKRRWTPNTYGR